MKKLVGGEYLLDLTPITIAKSVDGETYTNITNADVIEQLTNLKEFIRNPKAIKPVWIKFVNDEDDAVIVTRGSLSIVDDGEFDIDVSIKGYTLKIHVEFTQATLSDSTPIDDWYIDTNDAKYLFTSEAQNISPIVEDVAEDVAKDVIEGAESGTIADVLGLDSEGGLVKGTISSGTKLYFHVFTCSSKPSIVGLYLKRSDQTITYITKEQDANFVFRAFSTSNEPATSLNALLSYPNTTIVCYATFKDHQSTSFYARWSGGTMFVGDNGVGSILLALSTANINGTDTVTEL